MNDLGNKPSVKAIWYIIKTLYILGYVGLGLLILLLVGLLVFGENVKYIYLPISVSYANSEVDFPCPELNSHTETPIVGFKNIQVETGHFEAINYTLTIPLLLIGAYIWIMKLLMKFIKTVREGNPFSPENPKRVRLIGFLVTIGGPVVGMLQYMISGVMITGLDFPGAEVEINTDFYLVTIILGLVIYTIGHVFDLAVKINEEQKLTI